MKLIPTEPDIRTIVDRINHGDIDLQPEFQRQEVWSLSKKKRLIDTVIRGWSIPPVHLVETSNGQLEVLDGQQRLAALRDFVGNRFSIDGRITPEDREVESLHGRFYKQLEPPVRRRVDQYPMRCFRITDYKPEEPSELFYRLNQPTMLTAGEQRNALFGPARRQLKDLVDWFTSLNNNQDTLGFTNVRLAYDDVLARLLYFLEVGSFGSKSTESRISERFRSQHPFNDYSYETARYSIAEFSKARDFAELSRFNKASLLSWLLFFSRFSNDQEQIDLSIIQVYQQARRGEYRGHYIKEAVDVFEDRASLRVTDVSSVVFRDFVLCYLYHYALTSQLPPRVPVHLITDVYHRVTETGDASFEDILNETVDIEVWSSSL